MHIIPININSVNKRKNPYEISHKNPWGAHKINAKYKQLWLWSCGNEDIVKTNRRRQIGTQFNSSHNNRIQTIISTSQPSSTWCCCCTVTRYLLDINYHDGASSWIIWLLLLLWSCKGSLGGRLKQASIWRLRLFFYLNSCVVHV